MAYCNIFSGLAAWEVRGLQFCILVVFDFMFLYHLPSKICYAESKPKWDGCGKMALNWGFNLCRCRN